MGQRGGRGGARGAGEGGGLKVIADVAVVLDTGTIFEEACHR